MQHKNFLLTIKNKKMGQYFKPCILAANKKTVIKWVYSWDFNNGLKLMEHSYIENPFVSAVESLIWNKPERIVWAGDYADLCKQRKTNIFDRCRDANQVKPNVMVSTKESRFIINHSKGLYVDKNKVPKDKSNFGWKLHPLPLLTCEGNGRGGGDFRGSVELIGKWARDVISVSATKPKDFKELIFDVTEG